MSVALTNDPNIKGGQPLANRAEKTQTPNRWTNASLASALAARRAKNAARKAAAQILLKQLKTDRRDQRFKLKPLTPANDAKPCAGVGKNYTTKTGNVVPLERGISTKLYSFNLRALYGVSKVGNS